MHAYNFGGSGRNFTKLYQGCGSRAGQDDNVNTNFGRAAPNKIWEGKNVQNLVGFLTTFEFDHEYLWTDQDNENQKIT